MTIPALLSFLDELIAFYQQENASLMLDRPFDMRLDLPRKQELQQRFSHIVKTMASASGGALAGLAPYKEVINEKLSQIHVLVQINEEKVNAITDKQQRIFRFVCGSLQASRRAHDCYTPLKVLSKRASFPRRATPPLIGYQV